MANHRPNDRKRELKAAHRAFLETGENRAARRKAKREALKPKPVETPVTDELKAKAKGKKSKAAAVSDTTPEPTKEA